MSESKSFPERELLKRKFLVEGNSRLKACRADSLMTLMQVPGKTKNLELDPQELLSKQ